MAVQHSSGSVLWTRSFARVNYRARVKQREMRPDKSWTEHVCARVGEKERRALTSFLLLWLSFFSMFMASIWLRNDKLLVFSITCWYGDTALFPITTWPCKKYYRSKQTLNTNPITTHHLTKHRGVNSRPYNFKAVWFGRLQRASPMVGLLWHSEKGVIIQLSSFGGGVLLRWNLSLSHLDIVMIGWLHLSNFLYESQNETWDMLW